MNQILFTGDKNDRVEINKIIRVFCIIIIVFSIMIIAHGTYALMKKDNESIKTGKEPEINITVDGSSATVEIKHNVTISSLVYSLNNGEEMQLSNANGKKEIKEQIELPNEDTTLNIKIIDKNKTEYTAIKEFKYDENVDIEQPKIQIPSTVTLPGKITIIATDNKQISYIKYKWDNEEEVKVENDGTDKTKIETKIDMEEGKSKLIVTAVDYSGNRAVLEKELKIVTPPEITLTRNNGELIIRVKDEEEVTKVVYEINGTQYTKENTGENKKEFEIREQLQKGENIVKVTAYNKSNVTTEKLGKCTY